LPATTINRLAEAQAAQQDDAILTRLNGSKQAESRERRATIDAFAERYIKATDEKEKKQIQKEAETYVKSIESRTEKENAAKRYKEQVANAGTPEFYLDLSESPNEVRAEALAIKYAKLEAAGDEKGLKEFQTYVNRFDYFGQKREDKRSRDEARRLKKLYTEFLKRERMKHGTFKGS
jgi:hypothetical protein